MRLLKVRYRSAGDFLAHYAAGLKEGVFVHPTREVLTAGETVHLEVRFPELGDQMLLRGVVAWRRAARPRRKLRASVGLALSPSEQPKLDFLVRLARGELLDWQAQRRHRRTPTDWQVDLRVAPERWSHKGVLDDIGPGG